MKKYFHVVAALLLPFVAVGQGVISFCVWMFYRKKKKEIKCRWDPYLGKIDDCLCVLNAANGAHNVTRDSGLGDLIAVVKPQLCMPYRIGLVDSKQGSVLCSELLCPHALVGIRQDGSENKIFALSETGEQILLMHVAYIRQNRIDSKISILN